MHTHSPHPVAANVENTQKGVSSCINEESYVTLRCYFYKEMGRDGFITTKAARCPSQRITWELATVENAGL